jgi:hypothetical protein
MTDDMYLPEAKFPLIVRGVWRSLEVVDDKTSMRLAPSNMYLGT